MIEDFDRVSYIFRDYLYNFVRLLKDNYNEDLLSIILFGSVARGKWNIESDIDLFIIFSNKSSIRTDINNQLTKIISDYERKSKLKNSKGERLFSTIQDISLLIKDLHTFRTIFYDIAMDGIILFDKNQTGSHFLKKIKKRIEEKGLKRVFIKENDYYWERNVKFGEIIEL
ncbi:MAG: nucleotidyltransferase domain-containing protein [Candidatus Lokiarchaeota archaeon]|nr:nucleotidyltransferase domain-containing protein [Candidatus Lokiarchaeota archaeon]